MTRIDFYVLDDALLSTRLDLICKLAEKGCGQTQRVFIYCTARSILEELDARLWDFRPMSFVAHSLLEESTPESDRTLQHETDPVLLSSGEPGVDRTLLINLDHAVPPFFSRFERTLEVVNKHPETQESGRLRYRFYKQRGYPLQHHNV